MPFIVIDGIDGSGKTVQTKLLVGALRDHGVDCYELDFPRYDRDSSTLVKHYLSGDYGMEANDVNPYTASMFFAVDQAASYLDDWKERYLRNEVIISNRYSTSSLIHQGAKLPMEKRYGFFRWLSETIHDHMDLPIPDMTILLDVTPNLSAEFRSHGDRQRTGDIHENNEQHLYDAWKTARMACDHFNWERIPYDGVSNTPGEIHNRILSVVNNRFKLF